MRTALPRTPAEPAAASPLAENAAIAERLRETFEREGVAGLDALPAIGAGIAAAIGEMPCTGRWSRLEQAARRVVRGREGECRAAAAAPP